MRRGRVPTSSARSIIRNRLEEYMVSRPSRSKGDVGETVVDISDHVEDLWIFNPRFETTQVDFGERIESDLLGLALPDADIEKDDRIDYGSYTYEVDSVPEKTANVHRNDYLKFTLSRRHD